MTTKQVATMISGIGLPYAYYEFTDDTAKEPPFICFMFTDNNDTFADNENYTDQQTLVVELYTAEKSYDLENAVRSVLNQNGLPFIVNYARIDDEQLYIATFTTEVIITHGE